MCLVAVALDQSSRFPFVLAGNRDEFFDRPAARLSWWQPEDGSPAVLGGRDLQAGGTWLGLTAAGRLGVVTNVRDPFKLDPDAPSRGEIVPLWLHGGMTMDRLWPQMAMSGYNGFNLLALDFAMGECYWVSNTAPFPRRIEKGLFGLSNGLLDTPWPKTLALKKRMKDAVQHASEVDALSMQLFEALTDTQTYADEHLPSTGVSLEWERLLSSAMIKSKDGRYGTRCSTLVITERINKRLVTHVMERTYSPTTSVALLRKVTLKNWPPRHSEATNAALEEFESSAVSEQDGHTLTTPSGLTTVKKSRARSLIKAL